MIDEKDAVQVVSLVLNRLGEEVGGGIPVVGAEPGGVRGDEGGGQPPAAQGCTVTNPLNNQTTCVAPCPAGAAPGAACTPCWGTIV